MKFILLLFLLQTSLFAYSQCDTFKKTIDSSDWSFIVSKPKDQKDGCYYYIYKHSNKVAKEYSIINGKLSGYLAVYFPSGLLLRQEYYEDRFGKFINTFHYWKNGKLVRKQIRLPGNILKNYNYNVILTDTPHCIIKTSEIIEGKLNWIYDEQYFGGRLRTIICNITNFEDSVRRANNRRGYQFDSIIIWPKDLFTYIGSDSFPKREFTPIHGDTFRYTVYHQLNNYVLLTGYLVRENTKYHWRPIGRWIMRDKHGRFKKAFYRGK